MATGPGRHDAELTAALESARKKSPGKIYGGVLIVAGEAGHGGFSCQLQLEEMITLPSILRQIADQIEADRQQKGGQA